MSRPIRVLHVIQNLNYGGMERLFADIVRLLDRDRFESHVMVMDYLGRFGEGLEQYATIHHAPRLSKWSMLYPSGLIELIRSIGPEVVHTHSGVWYKVSLAARRAGVRRVVHTEHGRRAPDPWLERRIANLASRRTDVVVAVSDVLARHLRAAVVADPDRVIVIANGVDTELHRPRPEDLQLRKELNIGAGVPIIGSIGRLEPIKGYDIMVEALATLRRDWRNGLFPVLVMGGEGSERPRLERMLDTLGLRGSAFILGWRDDVQHLHSAMTFFTMSSRSEGTSVSLLEAMSAGLVPVVTDVGGNRAVLGPSLSHWLVPPLQPHALASAWMALLGDPVRRLSDGELARRRIQESFSLNSMVAAYQQVYAPHHPERARVLSSALG